ncbi:MAG: AI-2E family transporter [Nanoarchaeota archaeon]
MAEKLTKRYIAIIIVVLLGVVLGYLLRPYVNAFFGGFILTVLLLPFYRMLISRTGMRRGAAAGISIFLSIIILLIPIVLIISIGYQQVDDVLNNREAVIEKISSIDRNFPSIDIRQELASFLSSLDRFAADLFQRTISGLSHMLISFTIAFFLVFYLLVEHGQLREKIEHFLPFNDRNTTRLIKEFRDTTYSSVIVTGLIAVLQGVPIGLAFAILGLPRAMLFGLLGALLSFLPVVGVSLIWIPATIILFIEQEYFVAVGMLIAGIIVSNFDNVIRPALQKRIGRIHPLTTLIGVFIGLPTFGLLGIIVGPLLISYFLIIAQMVHEEYL